MSSFSNSADPNSQRLDFLSRFPSSSSEEIQEILVQPVTINGSIEMTERERLLATLKRGRAKRAAETRVPTREDFEDHGESDEADEPEAIEDTEIIVNTTEIKPSCKDKNDVNIEEVRFSIYVISPKYQNKMRLTTNSREITVMQNPALRQLSLNLNRWT